MNGLSGLLLAAIAFSMLGAGAFADTIKVGVIGPMSGPFALYGQNFKMGIDAWAFGVGAPPTLPTSAERAPCIW